uniref:Uncharacterized protein n=1 Tax=Pipistrellus kuhlii TaxID=59472 RepID=A0A7J7QZ67_PIPKU|nr:hypothetical protein mPipKuh1_008119 [Pipistrellus kuhlii]
MLPPWSVGLRGQSVGLWPKDSVPGAGEQQVCLRAGFRCQGTARLRDWPAPALSSRRRSPHSAIHARFAFPGLCFPRSGATCWELALYEGKRSVGSQSAPGGTDRRPSPRHPPAMPTAVSAQRRPRSLLSANPGSCSAEGSPGGSPVCLSPENAFRCALPLGRPRGCQPALGCHVGVFTFADLPGTSEEGGPSLKQPVTCAWGQPFLGRGLLR